MTAVLSQISVKQEFEKSRRDCLGEMDGRVREILDWVDI